MTEYHRRYALRLAIMVAIAVATVPLVIVAGILLPALPGELADE